MYFHLIFLSSYIALTDWPNLKNISYRHYFTIKMMSICLIWNFTLYVTQSLHFFENHPYIVSVLLISCMIVNFNICRTPLFLILKILDLEPRKNVTKSSIATSYKHLLPQRYHFLLNMVKDLNVFPFDNDMKKAHFGTKLCICIMRKQFQYIKETPFLLYI
jgi:hypothetical protein